MMKTVSAVLALSLLPQAVLAERYDQMFPGHPGSGYEDVDDMLRTFDYQSGTIVLPGGQASVDVPRGYYYLGPEATAIVLTDLWGNPYSPSLGMIFPADVTPMDEDAWGVEITYEEIGYVSDEDAESIDYADLLREMQADARAASRDRVAAGYSSMALIDWAETPTYDRRGRKLHWAKHLEFGEGEDLVDSLNYELRALGRHGVLNVNFIARMDQLHEVRTALPTVARMVEFRDGSRYEDFQPGVDTVAAVGVAGLIAGKTFGKKAGVLAGLALLLKKFWFILLLPFFWLKNLFTRR